MVAEMGQLGKYVLLRELGRGAYGTVYLARDTVLDVERALKVLHPAMLADEVLLERFRREARLAARLEHPHIVTVHDFGEDQGRFYIAMRYMAGGSLKARLEAEGPLPWDEVVRIAEQVAEGLAYAHEQGVVHRDLKPGNILFDERGNAAIGDFGFAKALSGAGGSLSLTASGGMVGTPPYMAPELWKNKGVGPAVDQYALACIVAEMLTGEVLFAGETPPEVMTKHVLEEPPLPETWPEDMPERVEEVLRKALAKEPGERYEDVAAFVSALGEEQKEKGKAGKEVSEKRSVKRQQRLPLSVEHEEESGMTRTLRGHEDWVRCVAFSPDGALLASAADDNTVRLWSVADGALLQVLSGHTKWVYSVAFSPDGRLLASGSQDGTVRLWRASDGSLLHVLKGHTGGVRSVTFSPTGDLLASGAEDYLIRLWRVSNGALVYSLKGHVGRVTSISFAPDGTVLASGAEDQTLRLWQISSGTLLFTSGNATSIYSVAFSSHGQLLASGSWQEIRVWKGSERRLIRTLEGHTDWVNSVAFSPDDRLLVSGSIDRTVRLWEVSSGTQMHILEGHKDRVNSVAFSPDGQWLASGSADGTIVLWPRAAWAVKRENEM